MDSSVKTKVYLYRHENYEDSNLINSIDYIFNDTGVINKLSNNPKVFIKLNLVGPFAKEMAITTNPTILDLVLSIITKYVDKENIIVGDNPAVRDQSFVLKKTGLMDIITKYGVNILDQTKTKVITCNDYVLYQDFEVSSEMVDADVIINLPKVKTHTLAYVTIAQKNFFGLIYGLNKSSWHAKASNPHDFGEALNDLYSAYLSSIKDKTILHIADGIQALEGDGPSTGGQKVDAKFIMASIDAISLDRMAVDVMKLDYSKCYINIIASERNLGNANPDNIEIVGNKISDFEDIKFLPPKDALSSVGLKFLKIKVVKALLLEHPKINKSKCIRCGECTRICPPKAMTIKKGKYPSLKSTACIRCWCCAEVCPQNAIDKTRRPLVGRIILK